jgi:hypothetical protein
LFRESCIWHIRFLGNIDTAGGEMNIVDHLSFYEVFELGFILGEA